MTGPVGHVTAVVCAYTERRFADTAAALTLPPTLDLRRFHVVDISLEQYDGEQTHSTVSVLRGTLTG